MSYVIAKEGNLLASYLVATKIPTRGGLCIGAERIPAKWENGREIFRAFDFRFAKSFKTMASAEAALTHVKAAGFEDYSIFKLSHICEGA